MDFKNTCMRLREYNSIDRAAILFARTITRGV